MTQSNDSARRHFVALSAVCLFVPFATVPTDIEFTTIASWYGPGFHGRKTASGARFDQNKMTAANRTLPFGTKLTVMNLKNGMTCDVVINDRGPYVAGRGIDLSREAARRIGMKGIAPVLCYNEVAAKRLYGGSSPSSSPAPPNDIEVEPDERNSPDLIPQREDVDFSEQPIAHTSKTRRLIADQPSVRSERRRWSTRPAQRRSRTRQVLYVAYQGSRRVEFSDLSRLNSKFVHNYRSVTL